MATIVLDVQDESLVVQIKKVCQLLKGVASVRVHKTKNEDITDQERRYHQDCRVQGGYGRCEAWPCDGVCLAEGLL